MTGITHVLWLVGSLAAGELDGLRAAVEMVQMPLPEPKKIPVREQLPVIVDPRYGYNRPPNRHERRRDKRLRCST